MSFVFRFNSFPFSVSEFLLFAYTTGHILLCFSLSLFTDTMDMYGGRQGEI